MSTASGRQAARQVAQRLAQPQAGIVSRRQLYAAGVTRWQVRAELKAGRWQRTGPQTLSIMSVASADEAARWVAVLEVGAGSAVDGVTALQAAGLEGITERLLHVSAPKSSHPQRAAGVRVHETRRFREEDVDRSALPTVRPAVAAVRAALWAVSDRQAALFVVAAVQQRLTTGEEVAEALATVRRHSRRRFLLRIVRDLVAGAESLGELDFAAACRKRGLPEPDRQVVRRLPNGRVYLDVVWERWLLTVEVDGIQHERAEHRLADALRDNEQVIDGRTVLRIPVLGLRFDEPAFLDQVERALLRRGWARQQEAA